MKRINILLILTLIICVFSSCYGDEQRLTDGVVYYPPKPDTQISGIVDDFTNTTEEIEVPDIVAVFSEEMTVFITPSGKKYHYSETCSGNNSMSTALSEALDDGKTACKRCVK